jgi:hypothetical protein
LRVQPIDKHAEYCQVCVLEIHLLSFPFRKDAIESCFKEWRIVADEILVDLERLYRGIIRLHMYLHDRLWISEEFN